MPNTMTDAPIMSEQTISEQARAEPPYLATLNESQREAVSALDGPVLVLAGAGAAPEYMKSLPEREVSSALERFSGSFSRF